MTPGAEKLACPGCGAAARLDSVHCAYCRAALQTVACASCFALMFLGSRFCPRCGAKASKPLRVRNAGPCPRCKKRMTTNSVGGSALDQCPSCGGVWLDRPAFEEICESREKQAAFLGPGSTAGKPEARDPTRQPLVYRPCPRCAGLMNRVNFAGRSGIVIDVCKAHGTWFDADELRAAIEFIRAGGLDLARADQLERLKEERRRIEARLARAPLGGSASELGLGRQRAAAGMLLRAAVKLWFST